MSEKPKLYERHELALERFWTAIARFMAPAGGPDPDSWEARAPWMRQEVRGDLLVAEHVHNEAGCCPPAPVR